MSSSAIDTPVSAEYHTLASVERRVLVLEGLVSRQGEALRRMEGPPAAMTDTDTDTDLVERLRGWWEDPTEAMTGREVYVDDLMQAAANEIERLRRRIELLLAPAPPP